MGSEGSQLHVAFFPLVAYGHMIPIADIARLFASCGVKATIITTPANAHVFTNALDNSSLGIEIEIFQFPSIEVGLPEGLENFEYVTADDTDKFLKAIQLLQEPLAKFLEEYQPNCIVADMFMPWVTDVATSYNIPRLVFQGHGYFALCVIESLRVSEPHKLVSSDDENFVVPNLPDEIKLKKMQLSQHFIIDPRESEAIAWMKEGYESETKGYGVIMNSFYELEPTYVDHHKHVLGRRSWHIGPVSLCNRNMEDKDRRGKISTIDKHSCLEWLNSKPPNSVIYLCFGSIVKFSLSQLHEIAMALEASQLNFIWVLKKGKNEESSEDNCFPDGFEQRTEGKGLIIKGWAPQVLILDHESTSVFVTHCGWNSILEGISAGTPMVTWPVFADQFYNEKLVTEIIKTGISVGSDHQNWNTIVTEAIVERDDIEKALRRITVGEDAMEIRRRAMKLKEMAWKAVEKGGSSYSDLSALIEELSGHRP